MLQTYLFFKSTEVMECGVCYEEPLSRKPLTCCRGILCNDCFSLMRKKICPFCRSDMTTPLRHYDIHAYQQEFYLSRTERRRIRRMEKLYAREYDRQRNRTISFIRKAGSELRNIILMEMMH